jgi:predicted CoA-binding protein
MSTASSPSSLPKSSDDYSDAFLRAVLSETKTIAVVGLSADPSRPSHYVCQFLKDQGYQTVGVNPGLAGKEVAGSPVYATLADIPFPVDMIDIFRNSEAAGGVVDEALALTPKPKAIWMQLDVVNDAAAAKAEAQGLKVVMNRCPKIEYPRLF